MFKTLKLSIQLFVRYHFQPVTSQEGASFPSGFQNVYVMSKFYQTL